MAEGWTYRNHYYCCNLIFLSSFIYNKIWFLHTVFCVYCIQYVKLVMFDVKLHMYDHSQVSTPQFLLNLWNKSYQIINVNINDEYTYMVKCDKPVSMTPSTLKFWQKCILCAQFVQILLYQKIVPSVFSDINGGISVLTST
jgi:hypothetical protein